MGIPTLTPLWQLIPTSRKATGAPSRVTPLMDDALKLGSLPDPWILPDPMKCGPYDARILGAEDLHVWTVVQRLQALDWSVFTVSNEWSIPIEAVLAVIVYYAKHHASIDAHIALRKNIQER